MPQLLDQHGRPIDLSRLRDDVAGPSVQGVRSIITGHPADGLTPRRLASILHAAEQGDALAYLELAEQMEEKYLHYLSVLGTRKRAVTQLEITVEAADDSKLAVEQADLIREWLDRDELQDELFDILDAIGKGFSHTEIIWETSANQWLPRCLEWRDPRWFEFDRVDGRTPLLRGNGGQLEPLPPYKFIFHQHKAKSGLAIRGGLARPVAWAYLFQNYSLKDWVAFAEVYGLPLRIGRYDNGETQDNIRLLMRAVSQISSDAAAVFPKSMDVEFVDAKGASGSGDLFEKLCDYLDRQVSKAVVGQTATTDAVVGGLGSGKEHGDVRDDIKISDAKLLRATINRQLVRPIVDLNYGPQRAYPKVEIGIADSWDAAKLMPAVREFVSLGGRIGMSAVRDKLGFEDPGADEEVLRAPAPAAPTAQAEPQGSPPAGGRAPGGRATAAEAPSRALAPLLGPLKRHSEAEGATASLARPAPDSIDHAVEADLTDWEELVSPAVEALDRLLATCTNLEEARDRLPEALASMGLAGALAELLARGGFAARLAGLAGADIQPGGDT